MSDVDLHKLEAEVFGASLSQSLLEIPAVVHWADSIVASEPEPDPTILAVSVDARGSRFDRLDAIDTLSRVSGEATQGEITNAFLGVLYILLDRNSLLAARVANTLLNVAGGLEPVRTPAGATIALTEKETRDLYWDTERELSALDSDDWHRPLMDFLLPFARYAERLQVPG
jgi:hypothetical protein